MTMSEMGHLESFFRVHSSEKSMANVLSYAEVKDVFEMTICRAPV